MSIKDKAKLAAGDMEIDMASVEAVSKAGEKGTVKFTPNAKAKDTTKLRMVQVFRLQEDSGSDYVWTGGQARRNDAKTEEKGKPGESGHVDKGWVVDHDAAAATPRTKDSDAAVSPAYRDYWPNTSQSQDGHKNGADVAACSLWDFPGWNKNCTFSFETTAQGADNGVNYGSVKWNFTIKDAKVVSEAHSFQDNSSATFTAAVDKFNDVYHNPGSSTAPKAAATKTDK
jgi:hypothetical protein